MVTRTTVSDPRKRKLLRLPFGGGRKAAQQPAGKAQSGTTQQPNERQPAPAPRPAARGRGLL